MKKSYKKAVLHDPEEFNNTIKKLLQKFPNFKFDYTKYDEYKPFGTIYKTEFELDNIAASILSWAHRPDSIRWGDWNIEYGIPRSSLYKMAERHEPLTLAIELAKEIVGSRRERITAMHGMNDKVFTALLGNYDYDYKMERREWKSAQTKQIESAIVVQMEKFALENNDNTTEQIQAESLPIADIGCDRE